MAANTSGFGSPDTQAPAINSLVDGVGIVVDWQKIIGEAEADAGSKNDEALTRLMGVDATREEIIKRPGLRTYLLYLSQLEATCDSLPTADGNALFAHCFLQVANGLPKNSGAVRGLLTSLTRELKLAHVTDPAKVYQPFSRTLFEELRRSGSKKQLKIHHWAA